MAPDRQQLEEFWRIRLQNARLLLAFAQNSMREVRRDAIPTADGNFAFEKALRAENFALAHYRRLLRMFTDLVLSGKVPDEDEWRA